MRRLYCSTSSPRTTATRASARLLTRAISVDARTGVTMNRVETAGARPAVFLDRDGTIIEDRGHLGHIGQIELFPFAVEALRMLQEKYLLFIVTNQSGVSLGTITRDAAERVNTHVVRMLLSHGITIQQVYCCFHARHDQCDCIKPRPYFIEKAAGQFSIDIPRSYSIGDHPHDVEFGRAAGATGLYVFTGHGQKHKRELAHGALCFDDLLSAAQWIMAH
ncbi:MAG: HAD-IIIA family hydrolase [Chitinivibrionales bacterium]|nr:HAD-IIIA family hydrolase [Chitinivibrionales bacterium]MBD3394873.1 HAD-IIIA family hydrolase [Chitinivibrionales bacterium]